ncbi:MAG: hypothetical protein GC172_14345 [Phycisphaera sp.]|nr:hypothetical protein [Phycisphaera sp.]
MTQAARGSRVAFLRAPFAAIAAAFVGVIACAGASGATPQRVADAVASIDRIGEEFRVLDARAFADLTVDADDPQSAYLATGSPDERMEQWLLTARRLAAELARLRDAGYSRHIDPEEGVVVGQIHLAPMRAAAHSLAVLVQDAAIRGDRDALLALLETQLMLVRNAASESTLASSLAAIAIAETHVRAVSELLERGAIDADAATAILALRKPLERIPDYGAATAAELETRAIEVEMDRLFRTPLDERAAVVAGLRIPVPVRLDDHAVLTARHASGLYLASFAELVAARDSRETRAKAVDLEGRLSMGEFGEILKALAPPALPILDGLHRIDAQIAAQAETLADLADGSIPPTARADAGHFYMRAAQAAARMSARDQEAILEAATLGTRAPAATTAIARQAIESVRDEVIAPLLAGSACNRCTLPERPESAAGGGLVRAATLGINGAVRVLIADALVGGERPANAPAAVEAISAALRIAGHLASEETYAHALAAQQAARDAQAALEHITQETRLDARTRAPLAAAVAALDPADPFGFDAAFAHECIWLGSRTFPAGSAAVAAFDLRRLESLEPNEVAYLLAMFTPEAFAPVGARRSPAFAGALVDIRPWFDLDAFARAVNGQDALRTRALREAGKRIGDDTLPPADRDASPLAWLDVTVPVDIELRTREASANLAALRRLAPANAANALAPSRRHGPLAAFEALMSSAIERLREQMGAGSREAFADGAADWLDDRATER